MNYGYVFESFPQLVLNVFNTLFTGKMNYIAMISLGVSGFMVINGLYRVVHGYCYRKPYDPSVINTLFARSLIDTKSSRRLLGDRSESQISPTRF